MSIKCRLFLGLSLSMTLIFVGCGDDLAPIDATVTSVTADSTVTLGPTEGRTWLHPAIDFRVASSTGVSLPGIEVELFAGGTGILTDLDGTPLNIVDPTYIKTLTDDRGLVRVSYLITLPDCGTADVTINGSVGATIGVTRSLWQVTYTVQKC